MMCVLVKKNNSDSLPAWQTTSIKLPSSVFASEFEEEVGLLNKAAPISGESLLFGGRVPDPCPMVPTGTQLVGPVWNRYFSDSSSFQWNVVLVKSSTGWNLFPCSRSHHAPTPPGSDFTSTHPRHWSSSRYFSLFLHIILFKNNTNSVLQP